MDWPEGWHPLIVAKKFRPVRPRLMDCPVCWKRFPPAAAECPACHAVITDRDREKHAAHRASLRRMDRQVLAAIAAVGLMFVIIAIWNYLSADPKPSLWGYDPSAVNQHLGAAVQALMKRDAHWIQGGGLAIDKADYVEEWRFLPDLKEGKFQANPIASIRIQFPAKGERPTTEVRDKFLRHFAEILRPLGNPFCEFAADAIREAYFLSSNKGTAPADDFPDYWRFNVRASLMVLSNTAFCTISWEWRKPAFPGPQAWREQLDEFAAAARDPAWKAPSATARLAIIRAAYAAR